MPATFKLAHLLPCWEGGTWAWSGVGGRGGGATYRLYIVYREVFYVPQFLHFEPSLEALSLRSDVISSIQILSPLGGGYVGLVGRRRNTNPCNHFQSIRVDA